MTEVILRLWQCFCKFNASNEELWEHFLRAQRPWEDDQLHWVEHPDGWHLYGSHLPPTPRRGLWPQRCFRRHGQ